MKVVNHVDPQISFWHIGIGECFYFKDTLYVCTDKATSDITGEVFNAVAVGTDNKIFFEDEDMVLKVNTLYAE